MNIEVETEEITKNSDSGRIGNNLFWMVWSGSISIANSVLLWIFFARMREVDELGRFTIVMGIYGLFYGACSLGLIPFLISEISRRNSIEQSKEHSHQKVTSFISTAALFLLSSGLICALLMAACGFLFSESWSVRLATLILSLAMIPTGLINAGEATAISFGKTRLIAIATTLENLLRTIIPFVLIYFGYDIWVICVSFTAVRIIASIIYLWAAKSYFKFITYDISDFKKLLKAVPTFGGTIILASINWQASIILLGFLGSEIESAKYGVASRFLIPVSILLASYASVIQPVITQYFENIEEKYGFKILKFASYPLIISIIAAIVSPFLSSYVLTAFFGERYADVAVTLDILAISVVPFCLVMIVSRGLIAINAQKIDLLANAIAVVICIFACILLIPKYGAAGAALAQLFSFLSMAIFETSYFLRKTINFRIWQKA